jgi:hypothetical protein
MTKETFKKYADDLFAVIADVNEKKIGKHIAEDNLVPWCIGWRAAATRIAKRFLMEAWSGEKDEE